jgi:hypothetical protein
MRPLTLFAAALLALALFAAQPSPVLAQDCSAMIGTFLTENRVVERPAEDADANGDDADDDGAEEAEEEVRADRPGHRVPDRKPAPPVEPESKFMSRSLISFIPGGLVFFTDTGQEGEADFAPFTAGQGGWRCEKGRMRATILDFTLPKEGGKQQIGRLDLDVGYNAKTKRMSGDGTLYLIPLDADPMAEEPAPGHDFELSGTQMEAR